MKLIDHVNPVVPGNWVRRGEDKRRKRGADPDKGGNRKPRRPPGDDPDGRTHIIDELA